jgi:hypothetical protein
MEKISWKDRVRNEKVLLRVKEEISMLGKIKRGKVRWICHVLRRHCLLEHFIERRIEVMRRRGKRRKLLLKERRKEKHWIVGCGELTLEVYVSALAELLAGRVFELLIYLEDFLSRARVNFQEQNKIVEFSINYY